MATIRNKINMQDTTIIGQAFNVKDGAIIISDSSGFFYVDGLSSWGKEYYKKRVQVTGWLEIEINQGTGPDEPVKQELEGERITIKSPKWSLVKKRR